MENNKIIKRYRHRKTSPEMLKKMKKLRENGITYKEISEKVGLSESVVQYWLSPRQKENGIKRGKKFYAKLTPKQKKEKSKKGYLYRKKYYKERYNNDEEFRRRHIQNIINSFNKRKERWIIDGLCSKCGRIRIDKKWKTCERCRGKRYI